MKRFDIPARVFASRRTDPRRLAAWLRSAAPRRARDAGGFAMLSVLLLVLLGATVAAATTLYTLLDLKSTQHYSTGNQAFAAAEAGLLDVINTINSRGIVNFQNDVVNSGIIPTTLTTISGFSNVTYQVTTLTSGANAATDGIATITGRAPLSAERVLKLNLQRGGFLAGPGALHLSNDTASGSFSGTSFAVDGNNHALTFDASGNVTATPLDPSQPQRPAVSTRNDTVRDSIIAALTANQKEGLTGLGYTASPLTPSVETTSAASTNDILRMVQDILTANGASGGCGSSNSNHQVGQVQCVGKQNVGSGGNSDKAIALGTKDIPQITVLTNSDAKIAGDSTGFGILVVEQNVAFNGNFNFNGLVLFMNPSANGITVGGSVSLNGSVWSPLPAFSGNGGITVNYCHSCLAQYADRAGNGVANGGNMPHPVTVTSWTES